jgi:hypothetical protein
MTEQNKLVFTAEELDELLNKIRAYEREACADAALKAAESSIVLAMKIEREACAKVCEDIYNDPKENNGYDCYYTRPYLECAEAIRSRGQA